MGKVTSTRFRRRSGEVGECLGQIPKTADRNLVYWEGVVRLPGKAELVIPQLGSGVEELGDG